MTNITEKRELRELLKIAYKEKSKTAFIIISNSEVDISEINEFPVFL